jgi:hypothetical protein
MFWPVFRPAIVRVMLLYSDTETQMWLTILHHGIRNTVTHTCGRSHLPRVSTWPLFTLHTLPTITHEHLTPSIYFLTPQNEQHPPRLGAHTQQPIDHAHQGAARNSPPVYTDNLQYYYQTVKKTN